MANEFELGTVLPQGTNLTSGAPAYEQTVMQNTARNVAPYYQKALGSVRADMASRGMLDSGGEAGQEGNVRQGYLSNLYGTGEQAAMQGANLTEQERIRQEQMAFEKQARDQQYNYLRDIAAQQANQQNQAQWGNLLGLVGGDVGSAAGGLLSKYLMQNQGNGLSSQQNFGDQNGENKGGYNGSGVNVPQIPASLS